MHQREQPCLGHPFWCPTEPSGNEPAEPYGALRYGVPRSPTEPYGALYGALKPVGALSLTHFPRASVEFWCCVRPPFCHAISVQLASLLVPHKKQCPLTVPTNFKHHFLLRY